MPESLEEIVEAATAAAPAALESAGLIKPDPAEEVLTKVAETAKTIQSDTKEELTEGDLDEFGLSATEQVEALKLMTALRDPAKAPEIIKYLAEQAGYKKDDLDTPKKVEAAKKGLVEELREALGEELAYLADKMGPVIEKRLKEQVEESQADIRESLAAQAQARLISQADTIQNSLGKRFFETGEIPVPLLVEMTKTMDRIKPGENQTFEAYMEDVLFVAAGKKGIQLSEISKSKAERIIKNRSDAPSRLASTGGGKSPKVGETAVHPKRQMTLADAVGSALEQAKAELTK